MNDFGQEYFEYLLNEAHHVANREKYIYLNCPLDFHRLFYGIDLYSAIDIAEQDGGISNALDYFDDFRVLISMVYNDIREKYEATEEYEKCTMCKIAERQLRGKALEIHMRYESQKYQNQNQNYKRPAR